MFCFSEPFLQNISLFANHSFKVSILLGLTICSTVRHDGYQKLKKNIDSKNVIDLGEKKKK